MKYLSFFSGGLDSTGVLYKIFQDDPDAEIDVVHLVLKNVHNRWEPELKASRAIVEWFRNNGYPLNYVEHVFEFNYGMEFRIPYDTAVVGFYAAQITRNKTYDWMTVGVIADDDQTWEGQHRTSIRTSMYTTIMLLHGEKKPVPWKYPLISTTKKEIVKMLLDANFPLDLIFTCRWPDANGHPCGDCHSCIDMKLAVDELTT